ncbi:glycosyltransferase [Brucepastera parasyntrophica]|uniref:glycosyltransferase n=1 Tax=Brucepastera parasyntrophica TaxID=2880008 RepID=UPI00210917C3|nr:glycosyltransferase [Brucepastera parasyntrophica]ULQ59717.1 glycosyltransferase [Brucepastera parasyntrophica]
MKQRIAFLYLETGSGHINPAAALARTIVDSYPGSSDVFLFDGFSKKMKLCRSFFVDGYALTSNYLESFYVAFYQLTRLSVSIRVGNYFVSLHGETHLIHLLREYGITKVVCMHEVLTIVTRQAINKVDPSIPLITIVTDPYTAHPLWFYEKNMEVIVFSEKLRREAIERYAYPEKQIHVFPFLFSSEYDHPYETQKIKLVRKNFGVPDNQKILLIAGGGEGLRKAEKIVDAFIRRKSTEKLIVVCGRNDRQKERISRMIKKAGTDNILVFGFVSFMPDLLNIADCVITKGGASMLMETLAVGKPAVFSTYIRGQEWGNIVFAVKNNAGWYIRNPDAILDKADEILRDPDCAANVKNNISKLKITNGLSSIASFIHDFKI